VKPWHEDDDFWETLEPFMFAEERWAAAGAEVDQVVSLLGLKPPAGILDLCCGPGRHSLELARRGFRVTGVDRTAAYIEKARERAEAEGLTIEFAQDDMRRFCRPDAFDGAVSLFSSFGYFENLDEDRQVLTNLRCSLREGGALVVDVMGKEALARVFRQRHWGEQDAAILLTEAKIASGWTMIDNRWIVLKGQGRKEFRVLHRLYPAAELSALLRECGFSAVEIYGDLAGAPHDHEAERLVAVAHK
jgi:SAM-dependent methyltransferase